MYLTTGSGPGRGAPGRPRFRPGADVHSLLASWQGRDHCRTGAELPGQNLFRSLGSAAHVLRIADVIALLNSPGLQVNTLGDGGGGALPRVGVFAGHANNQLTDSACLPNMLADKDFHLSDKYENGRDRCEAPHQGSALRGHVCASIDSVGTNAPAPVTMDRRVPPTGRSRTVGWCRGGSVPGAGRRLRGVSSAGGGVGRLR